MHQVRTRTLRKPPPEVKEQTCYHCRGSHDPAQCRFKHVKCRYCYKKGHIAAACHQKAKLGDSLSQVPADCHERRQVRVDQRIRSLRSQNNRPMKHPSIRCTVFITTACRQPWSVELQIQCTPVRMKIDTGATLSIMSQVTYDLTWPKQSAPPIKPTDSKLRTYIGEKLDVVGAIDADVEYKSRSVKLNMVIVKGDGPSLMGRDWLQHIRLD